MRRLVLAASVLLALSPVKQVSAYMYCREPLEPDCQSRSWTFEEDYAFQRCRSEVELFVDEINSYVTCLTQAAQQAQGTANNVVDEFNCRAKGGIVC